MIIKEKRGITLIALVITIIVMLILVAVTINLAIQGGLFNYAKTAKEKTEKATEEELNWTDLDTNMTIDTLIEKYNTSEVTNPYNNETWTYAWTCTNESWSNTIEYTVDNDANLTGDIVAKLYEKGTVTPEGEEEGTAYHLVIEKIGSSGKMGNLEWNRVAFAWQALNNTNKYITKVVICDGITNIGGMAFNNCVSLTSATIPNSVDTIGHFAFSKTRLTSLVIPTGVTTIHNDAFNRCTHLTSIKLPQSVTNISDPNIFQGCTSLTSITLPASIDKIGSGFFQSCTALTNIKIPEGVTEINSYMFTNCTSLNSIIIPNNVTKIWWAAFSGCTSLTNVTIPNSVTRIDQDVFSNCTNLTTVNYLGTMSQWNSITKGTDWQGSITSVVCSDGTVTL